MKYRKVNCLDTNHKVTEEKILAKMADYVITGRVQKEGLVLTTARELAIKELSEQ